MIPVEGETPPSSLNVASAARLRRSAERQPAVRLLCLPYAGASTLIFRGWRQWLAPGVELVPFDLPGRGFQVLQNPLERMDELVDALAARVEPLLDRPLALFGHAMGALAAYELSRRLEATERPCPRHLFVSAQRAPQLVATAPKVHQLPAAQLIAAVRAHRGAAAAGFVYEELGELLLPALRADVKMSEEYEHRPGPPLGTPITVFAGVDDQSVARHELEAWHHLTRRSCTLRWLPGDHFFVHDHQRLLAASILRSLETHPEADTSRRHALEVSGLATK